jgi:HEAT repeat protein
MSHKTQPKFYVVFQVAVLYLSSLLLGYSNSWGQAAIGAEITFPNEMLKQAEAQTIVPILIEALKAKETYFRWRAATALGNIGGAAKDAVSALTEALKDPNSHVRAAAASALDKIDPTSKIR